MIDAHLTVYNALRGVFPNTMYEMALDSDTTLPCVTYIERDNTATECGNRLGYSRILFTVKVWDVNIQTIQATAIKVDRAMRLIGFKRISSGELYDNQTAIIQKIMTYEALAKETY